MFCPLTKVEVIYRETNSEISSCQEIKPIDSFPLLRKELSFLKAACELLNIVASSQSAGEAAPELYHLLSFYLNKIPFVANPWTLAASYRLKLLKYEGLSSFPPICSECQDVLYESAYFYGPESWCKTHRPVESILWEQTELESCALLANCGHLSEICFEKISSELQHKINLYFDACLGLSC